MSHAPVKTAVVGLGYWGPNLVRNLAEQPSTSTVSLVCDQRAEALAAISAKYGVPGTARFEDVLASDDVEAVVIATPVGTHAKLVGQALRAGKHVFVEKPLAASSADAEALIRLARDNDLVLMVGHTFLYSPPVMAIRELIQSGELGDIYFISSSRVNLGIHQSDVSVIWDLGPHDFAILRYWLEELPDTVSAMSRSCIIPGIDDVAFVDLHFPSGTLAHVELSWLAPSKLRRTAVVGSDKMVVYDDMSPEPVRIFDSGVMLREPQTYGEFKLSYRTGNIVTPPIDPSEPLSLEMQDFCRSVRTGQTPRSSAEVGLDVVRLAEAASRSLELGGRPVSTADAAIDAQ